MSPGTILVVVILLSGSSVLAFPAPILTSLAAIIVLGVPHGALDGEVARTMLRPRFGKAWFPIFAAPYLSLVAFVLLAWHQAPLPTLALFLAASVWHFGSEDVADATLIGKLVSGGLPIAVPLLVQPDATDRLFSTIAGVPLAGSSVWLSMGASIWAALAVIWTGHVLANRRWKLLLQPMLAIAAFVVLPPLTAFAIYFVCVHAPAHTAALIANPWRAFRVHDRRSAWILAIPLTLFTLLIGAALWPLYEGDGPARLLALTIQGLAALTLPHMILDEWLSHRERSPFPGHERRVGEQPLEPGPCRGTRRRQGFVSRYADTGPGLCRRTLTLAGSHVRAQGQGRPRSACGNKGLHGWLSRLYYL